MSLPTFHFRSRTALASAIAALVLPLPALRAAEPAPAQFRDQIQKLEAKSRELDGAGKKEEAERVRREIGALQERSRQIAARTAEARKVEMRKGGARKVEARRAEVRKDATRKPDVRRADARKMEPRRERAVRRHDARRARQPVPQDVARRLHHMEAAVANLRAAGLEDVAAKVRQQADQMRRGGAPQPVARCPEAAFAARLDQLSKELRELQSALRMMKAQKKDAPARRR